MNLRAYQLFPILYDAVAFEGGTSTTPATYRIMLAQWEKAFLFKVFQFFPLFFFIYFIGKKITLRNFTQ